MRAPYSIVGVDEDEEMDEDLEMGEDGKDVDAGSERENDAPNGFAINHDQPSSSSKSKSKATKRKSSTMDNEGDQAPGESEPQPKKKKKKQSLGDANHGAAHLSQVERERATRIEERRRLLRERNREKANGAAKETAMEESAEGNGSQRDSTEKETSGSPTECVHSITMCCFLSLTKIVDNPQLLRLTRPA